ncbi:MAG: reverse transcriptase domain-containing protein, partial [bacterium]
IFMDSLTDEQKQKALRIHCFLTEKRDGRIKARAVADGRSQKRYMEEETYSPTVRLESIMLCSLIDALEQRYVATIDIKGAFLKAKVPGDLELIVKVDGELAEMFVGLNPDFKLDEHGVLYLRCDKALYGHIEAARLFYDELNNSLVNRMDFVKNHYDPCVYNRATEDGLVTIRTHVDDLKVSGRTKEQVQEVIKQLKDIYKEITVQDGEIHDYLGMIMEHDRKTRTVKINMNKYI